MAELKNVVYKGMETKYIVSNLGDVYDKSTGRRLSQRKNSDGYMLVTLNISGKKYSVGVHVLVASMFIPNHEPEYKFQVNHIDGNKEHNYYWNLEWVTPRENIIHAITHGLRGKLTYADVVQICKLMEEGNTTISELAELYNVNHGTIQSIRHQKNWTGIAEMYDTMNCKVEWASTPIPTVIQICDLIVENKLMLDEIAELVGVNHNVVCEIYHKKTFKGITDKYDFSKYDKYQRYDKDFLNSIQELMAEGLTNTEIRDKLGLKKGCKTNTLLYRQRRKFEKKR